MLRLYASLVFNVRELCFQSQAQPPLGCHHVKPPAGFEPAGGY